MPYVAQCNQCKTASEVLHTGADPDSAVVCGCCPEDHHHGQAAEGGTPCRPITIYALGDSARLAMNAGG